MKKLHFLLSVAACIMIASCTKDSRFIPGGSNYLPNAESVALKYGHSVEVIEVAEPDGIHDTESILEAFDLAKETGPGSIVKLSEGEYTIGFIEVRDFIGVFTGAGRGKSVIKNKPDLLCNPIWERNLMPALIRFTGGKISINNMTFHFNDGSPCKDSEEDLACILILADYSGEYMPENRYIKGDIENVDFIAGDDGGLGAIGSQGNVNMAIYFGSDVVVPTDYFPLTTGEASVRNCNFEMTGCGPDIWAMDEKSVVNFENNTINDAYQAIFIGSCMGTKVNLKGNRINNAKLTAIYLDGSDFGYYSGLLPDIPTRYKVYGNTVECASGAIGLYLRDIFRTADPATVSPQLFEVNNNTFITEDGTLPDHLYFEIRQDATAIQALNITEALIINNTFKGTGTTGVYVDGDEATGTYAEKIQLIGNNYFDAGYSSETVYLGEFSRNCKVVGVSNDEVVDVGVDNMIIGTKARKSGVKSGYHTVNDFKTPPEGFFHGRIK